MSDIETLSPDWPTSPRVHAAFTLRRGGVSVGPYESLNVGSHVEDNSEAVAENRRRVRAALSLPADPVWLSQVHGTHVANFDSAPATQSLAADAAITRTAGRVCVVQVADCLPVLFASKSGDAVGAAHAGWRGLEAGVLEATVRAMHVKPAQLLAWLGPAIGPSHFEVGEEVRAAFVSQDAGAAAAFIANPRGRWQCDLYALARRRLNALGMRSILGGDCDTFADPQRFFSFRRDGKCGRMAALIWLE